MSNFLSSAIADKIGEATGGALKGVVGDCVNKVMGAGKEEEGGASEGGDEQKPGFDPSCLLKVVGGKEEKDKGGLMGSLKDLF